MACRCCCKEGCPCESSADCYPGYSCCGGECQADPCGCGDCECLAPSPRTGEWTEGIDDCVVADGVCELGAGEFQGVGAGMGVQWAEGYLASSGGCKFLVQSAYGSPNDSGVYWRIWKCDGDSWVDVSEEALEPDPFYPATFLENGWWCKQGDCDETPPWGVPSCVCLPCEECEVTQNDGYDAYGPPPGAPYCLNSDRTQGIYTSIPVGAPVSWKAGYPAALNSCAYALVQDEVRASCIATGCSTIGGGLCFYITTKKWRLLVVNCTSGTLRDVTAEALNDAGETTTDGAVGFGCDPTTYVCTDTPTYFPDPDVSCDP